MTLREPIVEGAWYETVNHLGLAGLVHRVTFEHGRIYHVDGSVTYFGQRWPYKLTRRVYVISLDPAEVVAKLRVLAGVTVNSAASSAFSDAADIVGELLGVTDPPKPPESA